MGRQHKEMDWPGARLVPEGSGEQRKMEETGCEVICGAPTTPAVRDRRRRREEEVGIKFISSPHHTVKMSRFRNQLFTTTKTGIVPSLSF